MQTTPHTIKSQYEKNPYPPIPFFALPRVGEGEGLSYELGTHLRNGAATSHHGKRILVAGCGTFEAVVVAQTHPDAAEIVAVDVSVRSLKRLDRRMLLAKLTAPLSGRRLAPVKLMTADLLEWEPDGKFDYIIASNVLQHVSDSRALLSHFSAWLNPQGIIRIVTYPQQSRIWMQETGSWFRANGLTENTPNLPTRCRVLMRRLPRDHALRSCFESQPETRSQAGIIDAFFNAWEKPLSPLELDEASSAAGLALFAETQNETSRSKLLGEISPQTISLSPWEKLQVLDDLLELCANPVLWMSAAELSAADRSIAIESSTRVNFDVDLAPSFYLPTPGDPFFIPSRSRFRLSLGVRRAGFILSKVGISVSEVIQALRAEVGPRYTAPPHERILPGLSILDYPLDEISQLSARTREWTPAEWNKVEERYPDAFLSLYNQELIIPGSTLAAQANWIQSRFGSEENEISVVIKN